VATSAEAATVAVPGGPSVQVPPGPQVQVPQGPVPRLSPAPSLPKVQTPNVGVSSVKVPSVPSGGQGALRRPGGSVPGGGGAGGGSAEPEEEHESPVAPASAVEPRPEGPREAERASGSGGFTGWLSPAQTGVSQPSEPPPSTAGKLLARR